VRSFLTILICILTVSLSARSGHAQDAQAAPVESLRKAIASGDAQALMEHAGERVEIALPNKGSVYSRSQAVYVMKHFFEEHPPVRVEVQRSSESGGSRFVEGTYRTAQDRSFSLYLRLFREGEQWSLSEVRVRRNSE
jgi:hypothetical protein